MNVLYLYDSTQTYTNTVYEHISSFARYSSHQSFFAHQDKLTDFNIDLSSFDAVGIHFSIRLPFDQIAPSTCKALQKFNGLKFLFIQDEYDHTHRAWHWIKTLGIGLVFTVVPEHGIASIYPPEEFPNTRFVSNLTGYVPDALVASEHLEPPSRRSLVVGYRGRPLPIRYGKLGQEKIEIGRQFKSFCDDRKIRCDIAWTEEERIYGSRWYDFMVSCRAMLGSESGSNVFDWDGSLVGRIARYCATNKAVGSAAIYERFVRSEEIDGVMNQVSPRIFEAIAAKTVLVLYEGAYSGVVKAGEHFIPVKKDGSNLPHVICMLEDGPYVDAMAERAYRDVIASGQYSYRTFVEMVDVEIIRGSDRLRHHTLSPQETSVAPNGASWSCTSITAIPMRAEPPAAQKLPATGLKSRTKDWAKKTAYDLWGRLPEPHRAVLKPRLKKLLKRG
ncbi:MAG: hypothetical protein CVU32_01100 [Betaproteobacteria bacterium HGW-Betaproteobacteria-5]|jgi:hypothetical protein|nr:MAG: hypothetical protein CVU32_01100 [Betaproteobacteria bacterium HGW-Betaproteobacteria-5]PKO30668.1 MAG: hypothetical protein CVU34_19265 [Betaproteobacteria bacterium HGW-Betaproteobacteria-7]